MVDQLLAEGMGFELLCHFAGHDFSIQSATWRPHVFRCPEAGAAGQPPSGNDTSMLDNMSASIVLRCLAPEGAACAAAAIVLMRFCRFSVLVPPAVPPVLPTACDPRGEPR